MPHFQPIATYQELGRCVLNFPSAAMAPTTISAPGRFLSLPKSVASVGVDAWNKKVWAVESLSPKNPDLICTSPTILWDDNDVGGKKRVFPKAGNDWHLKGRAIYFCFFFSAAGFGFFFGFLVLCFPVSLLFLLLCFSCFSAFLLLYILLFSASPASLLFRFSTFCFPCFSAFLLLCFSASLLFRLLCFSCFSAFPLLYFLLSLLLCFSCFSPFLLFCFLLFLLLCFSFSLLLCFCTSVPFYFYYSTFSFLQSCVFAAPLPAPLLLCFLSLLSLCLSFSFALFCSVCILNETLERDPRWNPKKP